MAARFHVSGGGNWNSTSEWATTTGGAPGASVPGSADTATLDASSGGGTLTLDISPTIQTINLSAYTGTLAFGSNSLTLNSTGTVWTGGTGHSISGTPNVILTNSSATSRTISAAAVTEANSVNFDIQAGSGGMTITGAVRDLVFSGTYSGALANAARTVYGNLTLKSGMSVTGGTSATTMAATSGTKTITSGGLTVDHPLTLNGVGGTWQLQDNLTLGSTRTLTLTNGALDLNTYQTSSSIFTLTGSAARGVGNGTVVVVGNSATVLGGANIDNVTVTGTVTVNATYSGGTGTRTLQWGSSSGGTEARAINLNVTAGTDIIAIQGHFKNVVLTGFAGTLNNSNRSIYGSLTISTGATVSAGANTTTFAATSGSHTITSNGKTLDFPLTFNTPGATYALADAMVVGSTRTLNFTAGTLDLASNNLTTGVLSSSNSNARTLAFGTGRVIVTGSGATVFTTGTATNLTVTGTPLVEATYAGGTGTRTFAFGTTDGSESNAISLSVSAGTDTVQINGTSHVRNLDFTGFAGTLSNNARNIYGSLTLSAGMTLSAGAALTTLAATSGSHTITSNGQTMDFPVTVSAPGATITCADALTIGSTHAFTLTAGTLRLKAGTTNTIEGIALTGGHLRSDTPGSAATVSATSGTKTFTNTTITDIAFTGGAEFIAYQSDGNVDGGGNSGIDFGSRTRRYNVRKSKRIF